MNCHILATCRKPELLKFTTMVFSTLRVGFPTACVTVHANRLSDSEDDVLLLAASNAHAKLVRVDTIHHEWISHLLQIEDNPFWIVDTDLVFFERVEGFRFATALAGWRIPEWKDDFAGAITRARLHTSLLYFDPIKVESEIEDYESRIAKTEFTPKANLINPLVIPFKGKSYFYDTCSMLYHAIGGTAFTDEQKGAFCHLKFWHNLRPRFAPTSERRSVPNGASPAMRRFQPELGTWSLARTGGVLFEPPSMKTITCEDPGGTFEVKVPECIGAFYVVYSQEFKIRLLVTCIDATPDGQPKRMRVQRYLPYSGEVLQPGEYKIVEEFPLWQD